MLAGLYFPLRFLPEWLQLALWCATPFPSLLQTPLDVLVERDPPATQVGLVALQAVWAVLVLGAVPAGAAPGRAPAGGAGWLSGGVVAQPTGAADRVGRAGVPGAARAQARSQTAYRASFVMDLLGNVGATVFDVVTVAGDVPGDP